MANIYVLPIVLSISMFGISFNTCFTNADITTIKDESVINKSSQIDLVGTQWSATYNEGGEYEATETITFISNEWIKSTYKRTGTHGNGSEDQMFYYTRNQDDPNTGKIYDANKTTMIGNFVATQRTLTMVTSKKGKVSTYYRIK